ncbi:MAG: EF-hand domain-containing protein [Micropepsaceae bacterium]
MKTLTIAALAALIAVPAVAVARDGGGHHGKRGEMFERLDADKDGKVTAEEARAGGSRLIDRADRNGDGVITPDEAPRLFERIDADGDGRITAEEFAAISAARVMRADADGDGVVTKAEADAAREKMKALKGKRGGRDDVPAPPAGNP